MGVEVDSGTSRNCFPQCAIGTALVEAGVPVEVAAALADVTRAGRRGPGGSHDRPDLERRTSDGVLGVIESRDAVTSWLDSVAVDATRALVTQVSEDIRPAPLDEMTKGQRDAWRSDTRMEVAGEIEAATGTGVTNAHKLVAVAAAPDAATGAMLEGLRAGHHPLYRVQIVREATADLPPEIAARVGEKALAARSDGAPPSHQQFRRRLRREVARHASSDVEAARQARAKARRERRVGATNWEDGAGELNVSGSWERVVAALSRVDAIARRFRSAGDDRTLDQLRSDVALDLMLFGDICGGDHQEGSSRNRGGDGTRGGSGERCAEGDMGSRRRDGVGDDALAEYRQLGALPPARVDVIVSLSTLLGIDDGIGEMPGHGFFTAEHVREVALAAGSVWRRLVADPLSGRAVERSIEAYRPDTAMREQVEARDVVCRGPGCTVPATQCDVDHVREYRADDTGGPTSEPNLADLHRRHHNPKTKGFWACKMHGDGILEWRTLIGRRYATAPFDYRQFLEASRPKPEQDVARPRWVERPYDPGSYRVPDEDRSRCILGPGGTESDLRASEPDLRTPGPGELDDLGRSRSRSILEDGLGCLVEDAAGDRSAARLAAPQSRVDWSVHGFGRLIENAAPPPPF